MAKQEEKTNVMRLLDKKRVEYESFTYPADGTLTGTQVAEMIGVDPTTAFKTLVTEGKSGAHYVFDIPVGAELDLKKAAKAVGEKFVVMIKSKELLPLTGYMDGGCSPLGMKKQFPTFIDETAMLFDEIAVSAGRRGEQIIVNAEELARVADATFADLVRD